MLTMCQGGDCPLRKNCERHTIQPNKVAQEWFPGTPFKFSAISDNAFCDFFIEKMEEEVIDARHNDVPRQDLPKEE